MASLARYRLAVVAAAILFSTGGAAIKSCSLSGLQVAGLRSLVAAIALVVLLPAARRAWTWRTVLVGVAFASTMVLFVTANKLTTAANTIFLQSAAPLYLLLLAPRVLKEPVRGLDLGIMGVVAVGLSLFFVSAEAPQGTAPDPLRGNVLAMLSGVAWAFTLLGLRWLERSEGPGGGGAALPAVVAGNTIAVALTLPFSLDVSAIGTEELVVLAYLGVFQIGLAYVLLTYGLRRLPVLEGSLLVLVEPALNPVWAWLVHGESPGPLALLGGLLILSATTARPLLGGRA